MRGIERITEFKRVAAPMAVMAALFAAAAPATAGPAGEAPVASSSLSFGKVRADLRRVSHGAVLRLEIDEGWHVMADRPGAEYLSPLRVVGPGVRHVSYPTPEGIWVEGLGVTINVLKGKQEIEVSFDPAAPGAVTVTLQTCSEEVCLPPQQADLRL